MPSVVTATGSTTGTPSASAPNRTGVLGDSPRASSCGKASEDPVASNALVNGCSETSPSQPATP